MRGHLSDMMDLNSTKEWMKFGADSRVQLLNPINNQIIQDQARLHAEGKIDF
jgi:hypothetical protein